MITIPKKPISNISLLILWTLCLGFLNKLYAAENDEVNDEKETIAPAASLSDPNKAQRKSTIRLLNYQNSQKQDTVQTVAVWICVKCTFQNMATSKRCEICNANKPLPDEKHAIWTCAVCTLDNSIDNKKCVTCDNPHPLAVQHITPKHDSHTLAKFSPIDVKFMDYEIKKDSNQSFVSYRFKFILNNSECDISYRYSFWRKTHKGIIKKHKINDKKLIFPSKNILKHLFSQHSHINYLNRGNELQVYLISLLQHDKTDHKEILLKLGICICDKCKILHNKNKKCIKCNCEQIIINVKQSKESDYFEPFSISIPYTKSTTLNHVLDKLIKYINNKKDEQDYIYFVSAIGLSSFIEKKIENKIKSADNYKWEILVNKKITAWDKDKIIAQGLVLGLEHRYHHSSQKPKISCHYISSEHQSKYSGLDLALQCPIYRDTKEHDKFSNNVLNHLHFCSHFFDEYNAKPVCKYGAACKSFIRLEHNGNLIEDLCHIKLYRHPPRRNRQIQLNKNMHQFICHQNEDDNKPLYKPNHKEKHNLFQLLLDELIKNGYKHDLCTLCKEDDDCKHDVYQKSDENNLVSRIEDKFNHIRYKKMGRPFHDKSAPADALMLSLLLYTGCDCNYDMCRSQRNEDYNKWKIFDYCLWWAVYYLSSAEYGSYKLYSGLQRTKLSTKNIRGGYFPTYVSSTLYKDIAEQFMADRGGMMIEIGHAVRNKFICCDVSWLSKFPDEHEIVIARTIAQDDWKVKNNNAFSMKILDERQGIQIVSLNTNSSYDVMCKNIIIKISVMIGMKESEDAKATSLDAYLFNQLVSVSKDIPSDLQQIWEDFRQKPQKIKIGMGYMYRYYTLFIPLLVDLKHKNLLLFDKIAQLFPNATEIICHSTDCVGIKPNQWGRWEGAYSADIVNSNFMMGVKDQLRKIPKQAKLKKIIIMQTCKNKIKDDCNLYAPQFRTLGWYVGKGSNTIALTKTPSADCIAKISSMVRGEAPPYEAFSLDVSIFNRLLSGAKDIPSDVYQLWHKFRYQQQKIKINIQDMYKHYTLFMPLLFDLKCKNLLLFDRIAKLFPNVTEIICKDTNYVGEDARAYNPDTLRYSAAIVSSNFIVDLRDRLRKIPKQAKLTKIIIETRYQAIQDDCNLYFTRFGALEWKIKKASRHQISLTKVVKQPISLEILEEKFGNAEAFKIWIRYLLKNECDTDTLLEEIEDGGNVILVDKTLFNKIKAYIHRNNKALYDVNTIVCESIIPKISAIIGAKSSDDSHLTSASFMPILHQLISGDKAIPADAQQTWNEFRHQQQRIKIDMRSVYQDYKAFIPLLFDPKYENLLFFDKIAIIFPHVIEIICKDSDWDRDKIDEDGNQGAYSPDIVDSNFIFGIKERLSEMDKRAKLKKIMIQTKVYQIEDECELYAKQFAVLGWQIDKGSKTITFTKISHRSKSIDDGSLLARLHHITPKEISIANKLFVEKDEMNIWECEQCSFENTTDDKVCAMCKKPNTSLS